MTYPQYLTHGTRLPLLKVIISNLYVDIGFPRLALEFYSYFKKPIFINIQYTTVSLCIFHCKIISIFPPLFYRIL